jgi:hyaluronan synthase
MIAPDAIRPLVAPFHNERVGQVSCAVRAANADTNLLTRLIDQRYQLLNLERAVQGYFGAILDPGPVSAYRRVALEHVWSAYLGRAVPEAG